MIDRLPFYPAAGNHDSGDTEANDDREQLEDNFHIQARFGPREAAGRASLDPGLFYKLRLGSLLELVCVDTSWGDEEGEHWFELDKHLHWLQDALGEDTGATWRIPFCHHPVWGAGPNHEPMQEQIDSLVPLYRQAGIRLLLHGHEHNLQHGRVDGIDYVVSGAGGKLDTDLPFRFDVGGTVSWAAEGHCLLVEVEDDRIVITPYAGMADGDAEPRIVERQAPEGSPVTGAPEGSPVTGPIVLER